jgi:hypothetical protein
MFFIYTMTIGKETRKMIQAHDGQQVRIGTLSLHVDDRDFPRGYNTGYRTFHTHHAQGECIDIAHLFFLLGNGWGAGHSDMRMTGYIIGWLAALYEQDKGQFALSIDDEK